MRKLQLDNVILGIAWALLILVVTFYPAKAQEPAPYVCSTSPLHYEFRGIPQSWLNAGGWWYIADEVTLDGNVLKVSGIPEAEYYSDDVNVGEAKFGNADSSVVLKGDAHTAPCDPPKSVPSVPVTVYQAPAVVAVVSTGNVCTVQYPSLVVVCNG